MASFYATIQMFVDKQSLSQLIGQNAEFLLPVNFLVDEAQQSKSENIRL